MFHFKSSLVPLLLFRNILEEVSSLIDGDFVLSVNTWHNSCVFLQRSTQRITSTWLGVSTVIFAQRQCLCLKAGKDSCVHVNVCRSGLPDLRCLHCCWALYQPGNIPELWRQNYCFDTVSGYHFLPWGPQRDPTFKKNKTQSNNKIPLMIWHFLLWNKGDCRSYFRTVMNISHHLSGCWVQFKPGLSRWEETEDIEKSVVSIQRDSHHLKSDMTTKTPPCHSSQSSNCLFSLIVKGWAGRSYSWLSSKTRYELQLHTAGGCNVYSDQSRGHNDDRTHNTVKHTTH